jgi:hypothetical protein
MPVAVAARTDADGSIWQSAKLPLAPLAPGDYVLEIATGPAGSGRSDAGSVERSLTAFRVIQ